MAGASAGAPECGMADPARRNRSPLRLPVCLPEDALKPSRDATTVPEDRIFVKMTVHRKMHASVCEPAAT